MTVDAFTVWGLQTGLMVSVLIGLVLVIRRPFARYFGANAAYALWLLPAVRLFLPPMTVPFITRRLPSELSPSQPDYFSDYASHAVMPERGETSPASVNYGSITVPDEAPMTAPDTILNAADPITSTTLTETSFSLSSATQAMLPILTVIWLGLAGLWFGLQLYRQHRFMQVMIQGGVMPPASLQGPIKEAMALVGLKRCPKVMLSSKVSGPMVTGVINPLIMLPIDFEDRFAPHQRSFALVHEMAHIKRGDLWAALGMLAFRALFWPNPLVHYAAHKMRVDQEAACDASVLAKTGGALATHSYAETLIHAAKTTGRTHEQAPLGFALSEQSE